MITRFSTLIRESFFCTAGVEEVYTKYYSKIPRETFESIASIDPTTNKDAAGKVAKLGKYSQWLLKMFQQRSFLLEDSERVAGYLKKLIRYAPRLKAEGVSVDINSFDTPGDLAKFLHEHTESLAPRPDDVTKDPRELLTSTYFINNGGAEKVLDTDKYLVVKLNTLEASQFYGADTEWCTRFSNNFVDYSAGGPLWVLISKTHPHTDRFQFHFNSNQFMDVWDKEADVKDIFRYNPELESFFKKRYMPKELEEIGNKAFFVSLSSICSIIAGMAGHGGIDFDRPKELVRDLIPSPSIRTLSSRYTLSQENIEKINKYIERTDPNLWDILTEEEMGTDSRTWDFLNTTNFFVLTWTLEKAVNTLYMAVAPDIIEERIASFCSDYLGHDFSAWPRTGNVLINPETLRENWWKYNRILHKRSVKSVPGRLLLVPELDENEYAGIPTEEIWASLDGFLEDLEFSDEEFNRALSKELDSL